MRVFVTGANGFIGSSVVKELIDNGHQVLGLSRSDAGVKALKEAGAEALRGDIGNPESLREGATKADAVIHTAFNHDFSKFVENCESDRKVIGILGDALVGTDKLLIVSSGVALAQVAPGQVSTETDPPMSLKQFPRAASEEATNSYADKGVRVAIVRLSQIHDTEKQGLVSFAIQIAREKGVSAYIGEGKNAWAAAPRWDTARLYRLALEKTGKRAIYHAVEEEGVPMIDIATVIGRGLKVPVKSMTPEEAAAHFGWMNHFAGLDIRSSSAQTRKQLGWNPTGPSLITDLENMRYS
ncbi:MAG TPA: SDR family oxidoreductase [Candidatus Acidoferrum sp.]|jgi:nucleoside-diphosphate-sugar epimerase